MNKFLLATAAAFCSFAAVAQTPAPGQAVAMAAKMKNDDKPRTAADKARQEAAKDQRKADEQREKAGDKLRKEESKDRSEAAKPMKHEHSARGEHAHGDHGKHLGDHAGGGKGHK